MPFWWIICAWLAAGPTSGKAEPAPGKHEAFPLATGPLAPGLALAREPNALLLTRGGVTVDRLTLPAKPSLARRRDDHAVLALGHHGLWIVRLDPRGRLVVVARHRLTRSIDGFLLEGDRVIPTSAGEPILKTPPPTPPPPTFQAARTPHDLEVWPVEERLRALDKHTLQKMIRWPSPTAGPAPVSWRPRLFLETNFLLNFSFSSSQEVWAPGIVLEPLIRVGYHVTPSHVVGVEFMAVFMDERDGPVRENIHEYLNPFFLFYRFSFETVPVEVTLSPLATSRESPDPEAHPIVWGARFAGQWVKRSGRMRLALEGRLDVFWGIAYPSVAVLFGLNL